MVAIVSKYGFVAITRFVLVDRSRLHRELCLYTLCICIFCLILALYRRNGLLKLILIYSLYLFLRAILRGFGNNITLRAIWRGFNPEIDIKTILRAILSVLHTQLGWLGLVLSMMWLLHFRYRQGGKGRATIRKCIIIRIIHRFCIQPSEICD